MIVNDTLEIIKKRRSTRRYAFRQPADEALVAALDAARQAPFAGTESRYFAVVQDEQLLARINADAKDAALYMDNDGLRALGEDPAFHSFHGAPSLVIVCAQERSPAPESDCAAATQNFLIAAESVGLGTCWVFFPLLAFYGPDRGELLRILRIPSGYRPYTSIAVGYPKQGVETPPSMRGDDAVMFFQ